MSDYTIEPTGPLTRGSIPDADLDRLIDATIPAPTWRDYLDRLTAEQVAQLDRMAESLSHLGEHPQAIKALREQAEYLAACNVIDARYADVPLPAGATTDGSGWARNNEGRWQRPVEWAAFPAAAPAVEVSVDGWQSTDGTYSRDISLYAEDCDLSAEQARALAAVLLAAADELDRLDGREQVGGVSTALDRATLQQATEREIVAEIVRRHAEAGSLLRLALAEADPAALTREDRAALVDVLERALDAGGTVRWRCPGCGPRAMGTGNGR